MITLIDAYVAYLRDPAGGRQALVRSLEAAGYTLEAGLLRQARAGRLVATRVDNPGAWAGRRAFVGSGLPTDAAAGDIWFDTLEVVPMILLPDAPLEVDLSYSAASWRGATRCIPGSRCGRSSSGSFGGFLALARIGARPRGASGPPFSVCWTGTHPARGSDRPGNDLTAGEARTLLPGGLVRA